MQEQSRSATEMGYSRREDVFRGESLVEKQVVKLETQTKICPTRHY